MSKHTPGPWNHEECEVWSTETGGFIASTRDGWQEEDIANARLISAAPDMLKVLQMLAGPFEAAKACGMPIGEATIKHDSEMLKKIRAAIAKATGDRP